VDQEFENAMMTMFADKGKIIKAWREVKIPKITDLVKKIPQIIENVYETKPLSLGEKTDVEKIMKRYPEIKNKEDLKTFMKDEPGKFFYDHFKDTKGRPKYVSEVMDIMDNPVKFDLEITEKDGEEVEKEKLNEDDKWIADLTKKVYRQEDRDKKKEVRDRGMSKKEITERNKKYKDHIEKVKKQDLVKLLTEKGSLDKMDEEITRLKNLAKKDKSKKRTNKLNREIMVLEAQKDEVNKVLKDVKDVADWLKKLPEKKTPLQEAKDDLAELEGRLERAKDADTKKKIEKKMKPLQDFIDGQAQKYEDMSPEEQAKYDKETTAEFVDKLYEKIHKDFYTSVYTEPEEKEEDTEGEADPDTIKNILKKKKEKGFGKSPFKKTYLKDMSDSDAKELINDMNKTFAERNFVDGKSRSISPEGYLKWRKNKKASIFNSYKKDNSVLYKLERLASVSNDSFVKAELLDILDKYKELI
jgi:hypothetical protein